MRIPAEIAHYMESAAGRTNEPSKTEPVRNASATGYGSSNGSPNHTFDEFDDTPPPCPAKLARGNNEPAQERRCGERRNENKPVLLDTRMQHIFRRKAESTGICLTV